MKILFRDDMSYLDLTYGVATVPEYYMEMDVLKDLWESKKPGLVVDIKAARNGDKFEALMTSSKQSALLCAETLDKLIAEVEQFLRSML